MSSSKQPREAKAPIRSPNVKALEQDGTGSSSRHSNRAGRSWQVLGGGIRPLLGLLEVQQSFHEGLWTWQIAQIA